MKIIILPIALILASCVHGAVLHDGQQIIDNRTFKKIEQLQKKLEQAEIAQEKAEAEVKRLSKEINEVQLAFIRKRVDEIEAEMKRDPEKYTNLLQIEKSAIFHQEREMLHRMIQQGYTSPDAAAQLDRILRLITEFSDTTKR